MKILSKILLGSLFFASLQSTAKEDRGRGPTPLFTENKGQLTDQDRQARPDIHYYGSSDGLSYFFKNTGISYQLYSGSEKSEIQVSRVDMIWLGANSQAKVITQNKSNSTDNFYNTSQTNGVTAVHSFGDLQYNDIYKGINLHYYYKNGSLKYDFIVAPRANYKNIRVRIEGAISVSHNRDGTISIVTPNGTLTEAMPVALQGNKEVKASWLLEGDVLSFQLADYDPDLPLIIDPLVYQWTKVDSDNTTSGGYTSTVSFHRNVADAYGNVYAARNFSIPGGLHQYLINLCKFTNTASPSSTIWNIYLFTPDFTSGARVEGLSIYDNAIYVSGGINVINTIATSGAYQTTISGQKDGFLLKYDSSGTKIWGTYYGGTANDIINNCKVDSAGYIYVCGTTQSTNNMAGTTAAQGTLAGLTDAFIAKFNTTNGFRTWGTYFGGSDIDSAKSIDVRGNRIYISGITKSASGIATAGAQQSTFTGNLIGFLLCKDTAGTTQWSTYYGTDTTLAERCITSSTAVYLAGSTNSTTGIATSGTHQSANAGGFDGFLAKFSLNGVRQWGTYYGGADKDLIHGATMGKEGRLFISGNTKSYAGIATINNYNTTYVPSMYTFVGMAMGSAALAEIDTNGVLISGTYFNAGTIAEDCNINSNGDVFISGLKTTVTDDFIPFIAKFNFNNIPVPVVTATPASFCANGSSLLSTPLVTGTTYQWYRNDVLIPAATGNTYTATLAGSYKVVLNGIPTATSLPVTLTIVPLPTTVIAKINAPCATAPTGSITVTPSGGAAPYSYAWVNSASTSATRSGLVPGTYIVNTTDANTCVKKDTVIILNTNSGPATVIAKTDAPCAVATIGSITVTPSGGTAPYSYVWDNSANTSATLSGLTPGNYIVHTTDVNTCSKTDTVTILNTNNNPVNTTTHTNVPCYGAAVATITVTTAGGTTPYSYTWNNLPDTTAFIDGLTIGTYVVHTTDVSNCSDVDTVEIVQDATIAPSDPLASICAVTVDSITGNNKILWQKAGIVKATAYNIYRESTVAGQYELIGTNSVNDNPVFIDATSVPLQQSYSYKIAEVDSCDHEWTMSDHHTTIHLSANVGVNGENNLSWNAYEGKSYATHNIMRSFNGGPFTLLNQVSSTITSYSDLTPPMGNNVYRIMIDLGVSCDTGSASQQITSNKISLGTTGIDHTPAASEIQILPNPTTGILYITGSNPEQIRLYDATGRLIIAEKNVNQLDISKYAKGIFMIHLFDKKGQLYFSQKIVLK